VKKGVAPEDIAAATAQVTAAQAKLDAVKKGAAPEDIAAATADVSTAQPGSMR